MIRPARHGPVPRATVDRVRPTLALLVMTTLGGCSSPETMTTDASGDAPTVDAPSDVGETGLDTGVDVGAGPRTLSVVGGFGSGGSVDGDRYHLVAQGFDWGTPMCAGVRCVVGGFVR